MKRYEVEINGMKTTIQLSDADAKARGLVADDSEAGKPAAKSKTPANKQAKAPANKGATGSQSAADKRAEAAASAFGGGAQA